MDEEDEMMMVLRALAMLSLWYVENTAQKAIGGGGEMGIRQCQEMYIIGGSGLIHGLLWDDQGPELLTLCMPIGKGKSYGASFTC